VFKFDTSLIVNVIMIHTASGFMRILELGMYALFHDKLNLPPKEVTLLVGLSIAPWLLKTFLAIISDSFTFWGTRRKSYLILSSAVNVFALSLLMVWGLEVGKLFIVSCIMVANLMLAWLDTIDHAMIA
jgi:hypothetical protein